MTTGTIGVAISTTGQAHRMGFLETAVKAWRNALPLGSVLVVTVDGDKTEAARAYEAADPEKFGTVYRVGQPLYPTYQFHADRMRMGVAVNKNTGIEFLMEMGVEHLFLADDDVWPRSHHSLDKHIELERIPHSMVCWGSSRLVEVDHFAEWNWPRGVMLYTHRSVVEEVGGMDERFGNGGHEHAEWSMRIHNAGLTPTPFISPASYGLLGVNGKATRADALWHAEDMRLPGEMPHEWNARKKANTTIRRTKADWERIEGIMAERAGDTSFVPYQAHENGRSSATLCRSSSCDCAQEPEPETPRSDT